MDKNMREFKFRVWHVQNKMMYFSHRKDGSLNVLFNWSVVFEDYANDPNLIKMQYTGLKDKNGNEIYEGDILTYNNPTYKLGHETPYVIRWNSEEACFECMNKSNFMMASVWGEMEIIGNVVENPELLE